MRRLATLALVLCAPLSACGSSSHLPSSPKAWRGSIVAAALAQKSVHWTGWSGGGLGGAEQESLDVAVDSGRQRLNYYGAKVEFRLVDDVVYVRGNSSGLSQLSELSLTRRQAKRYAGQWIAIPKGDRLYAPAADRLTLASLIHDETPSPTHRFLKTVTKWSHGTKLRVLQGRDKYAVFQTLSVHATGDELPVGATGFIGPGHGTAGHFSKWNEPVNVQAPARSTPIADVRKLGREDTKA